MWHRYICDASGSVRPYVVFIYFLYTYSDEAQSDKAAYFRPLYSIIFHQCCCDLNKTTDTKPKLLDNREVKMFDKILKVSLTNSAFSLINTKLQRISLNILFSGWQLDSQPASCLLVLLIWELKVLLFISILLNQQIYEMLDKYSFFVYAIINQLVVFNIIILVI